MSADIAYPVQLLREHLTALEAAITVCMAAPDGKPVHKLRTETRRVEALLLLLALVPGLPEHSKEAGALRRSLGRIRRAAGEVRDLDVHRKMLEEFAEQEAAQANEAPAPQGRAPKRATTKKAAAKKPASTEPDAVAAVLTESATDLQHHMAHQREKAAAALQTVLAHRQVKTALAAETLMQVLKPREDLALPAADLLRDAETVLMRNGLLADPAAIKKLKEDDLHQVRKAAKAARYLAESLPKNAALVAAARDFESLQEAGGQWHDALELARAARRHFSKSHELTANYRRERERNLEAYHLALQTRSAPTASPSPASRPRAKGTKKRSAKRTATA